jgi:hypothetical protein
MGLILTRRANEAVLSFLDLHLFAAFCASRDSFPTPGIHLTWRDLASWTIEFELIQAPAATVRRAAHDWMRGRGRLRDRFAGPA